MAGFEVCRSGEVDLFGGWRVVRPTCCEGRGMLGLRLCRSVRLGSIETGQDVRYLGGGSMHPRVTRSLVSLTDRLVLRLKRWTESVSVFLEVVDEGVTSRRSLLANWPVRLLRLLGSIDVSNWFGAVQRTNLLIRRRIILVLG